MILLDVNILVAAHREDADQHREIKSWLEATLGGPAGVAVSELALSGCLRVITHPKIFKKPTPLAQALDFLKIFGCVITRRQPLKASSDTATPAGSRRAASSHDLISRC